MTDFIEPQNLFALAVNSPPSRVLDGACGAGPEGKQLGSAWHIGLERERDHFFLESIGGDEIERDEQMDRTGLKRRTKWGIGKRGSKGRRNVKPDSAGWEMSGRASPVVEMYERLSTKRTSSLL